jgi:hypothetical protein
MTINMEKDAADRIEELEAQLVTLRELISEIVESKTTFQTQWDKDAMAALEHTAGASAPAPTKETTR